MKRPSIAFKLDPDATLKPSQLVAVTLPNVPFVKAPLPKLPLAKLAVIPLIVVPEAVAYPSQPVEVTLVNEPFVNVADVPVKLAIIAEDVTFKLAVTKFPVEVPPANWIKLVVTFPCVVTCCKVGVAFPAGQFVPFAKHGNWPPINNDVKLAEVPTTFAANKLVDVELVDTSLVTFNVAIVPFALTKLPMAALLAFNVVPEARAKPSQPVEVTLVNDPLVAVSAAKFKLVPVAFVKINCVEVAADKIAVPLSKFTLFAVRFNAVKLEPEAEAKPSH